MFSVQWNPDTLENNLSCILLHLAFLYIKFFADCCMCFHLQIVGEHIMYERVNEALVKGTPKQDATKMEDDSFL